MPKLISLEEHNAFIMEQVRDPLLNEPRRCGVACPRCEKELVDVTPGMILASNPPQKKVRCSACGWTGTRLI